MKPKISSLMLGTFLPTWIVGVLIARALASTPVGHNLLPPFKPLLASINGSPTTRESRAILLQGVEAVKEAIRGRDQRGADREGRRCKGRMMLIRNSTALVLPSCRYCEYHDVSVSEAIAHWYTSQSQPQKRMRKRREAGQAISTLRMRAQTDANKRKLPHFVACRQRGPV